MIYENHLGKQKGSGLRMYTWLLSNINSKISHEFELFQYLESYGHKKEK